MDVLDRLRMDVPVAQAGMGGGIAGPDLAVAVANAGGLGTLGWMPADWLRRSIDRVRADAPGRAVAVNLLMPFVRRADVRVCVQSRIDVAVIAFGGDSGLVRELRDAGVFVFVMVGTADQARRAVQWGADGLIAQGGEAGGHLTGTTPASEFLPTALNLATGRPVLLAGGIADAADTKKALSEGASAVVAGTRFLLTHESGAHPEYQRRVLAAETTYRTTLFGFGWPAPHRVVPNAATARWCHADGTAKLSPRLVNAPSAVVARLGNVSPYLLSRAQSPRLPLFSPVAPVKQMPASSVDRTALYAGESVLRMTKVTSAREAVAELAAI
ncbi:MAG TPA: nitronate monooxygenase [Mycobacterium sp.]|nr:nitronate monooxygenase [Mycobacterium sp.]